LLSSAVLNQGRSTGGTAKRQSNDSCATYDLPNPLAEAFPNAATGVLNATLVIIPIPLEEARRLIPSEYDILERAYRDLVPDFPEGMYPVMVQAAHDHDVQFRAYNLSVADFSVCTTAKPLASQLNLWTDMGFELTIRLSRCGGIASWL